MSRHRIVKVLGRLRSTLAGGLLTLAMLVISILPAAAAAPPTFAAATNFATGPFPTSVAAADLNGDGMPDLAATNWGNSAVSVLRNTTSPGSAIPTFSNAADFAAGTEPYSVAIADLNGDGRPDLAVANSGSGNVSVLRNTTSPGTAPAFAAAANFATGSYPYSVAAADLNGDGRPDLATANSGSHTISVLLNTTLPGAAPTFVAQATFATGNGPYSVAIADLNGDGRPDLATANYIGETVSVLLNTTSPGAATPTFASAISFAAGSTPYSVTAADLNGDGMPDLITANYFGHTISVLLNTTTPGAAAPTFATAANFSTGSYPHSVAAADLNGDGRPDLSTANYGSNTVSVLRNTTLPGAAVPTFAAATNFATSVAPTSVAAADLNGDGKPDLAATNHGGDTVSVLLNTTPMGAAPPTFAAAANFATGSTPYSVAVSDLNGDGKPDLAVANLGGNVSVLLNITPPGTTAPAFDPAVHFAAGNGPNSVAAADLNGDGKPDLAVANLASNNVSVLLNTTTPGAATPTFAAQATFAIGSYPYSVAVSDLNGDGRPDLITANYGSHTVSVLLNTTAPGAAAPTFATQVPFATGSHPTSVAVADLNGDGRPDLAVANTSSNTVSVLRNTTTPGAVTPTFAAQATFDIGAVPLSVAATDLNGDGRPDLAVANTGNTVSVLRNTTVPGAAPAFAPATGFATGSYPYSVAVADLNGDGKLDLTTANRVSGNASVLLNVTPPGAAPAFATKSDFAVGSQPCLVAAADLNGDGGPDLAVANENSNTVSVLLNTTTASLALTKTASPALAFPGQAITYTLAFTNTNLFTATGVMITDTLPISLTGVSVASSVTLTDTGAVPAYAWQVQNLAPGTGGVITITGVLSSPLPPGIFTNTAIIDAYGVVSHSAEAGMTVAVPEAAFSSAAYSAAEDAGQVIITVTLSDAPFAPTTVQYATGDHSATAGSDYIAASGVVTFAIGETSQTFTVTITDDVVDEADETVDLTLSSPSNATLGSPASATLTIYDNDSAGVVVTPTSLTVAEPAGSAVFTITLTSQPTATVVIGLTSSDATECTVPASVSLTAANWQTGVTVTVSAVDDMMVDGSQACTVQTSAGSSDSNYNAIAVNDVAVTVTDSDSAGVVVTPTSLTVAEPAGSAVLTITLTSEPAATVTINLISSDATECTVPASVSLTAVNWQTGVTVTVSAVDDMMIDGSQVCTVQTSASSSDGNYNAIAVNDVAVTVTDSDSAGVVVTPTSLTIAGPAGSAVFTISLTSRPTARVTVPLAASTGKCTVPAVVDILSVQWQAGVTVTVHGVDDGPDGPQLCLVQLLPLVSDDAYYHGLDPDDVSVTVIGKYRIFLPVVLKAK